MNGEILGVLIDSVRSYPEQIKYSLKIMNGESFWAYGIWRAPEDADLLEDLPFTDYFIQCAGAADALTIEVSQKNSEGILTLYTLGKPTEQKGDKVEIKLQRSKAVIWVSRHEIFTAEEAASIFYQYFLDDTIPKELTLRKTFEK